MEHDSGLFGIHKSVWQDWPCILRAVRVIQSVKHKLTADGRDNGKKRKMQTQKNYKRDKEWKSLIGISTI